MLEIGQVTGQQHLITAQDLHQGLSLGLREKDASFGANGIQLVERPRADLLGGHGGIVLGRISLFC